MRAEGLEPEPELDEDPGPEEEEEPDEPPWIDFDTGFRACARYTLADGPVDRDARAALHGLVTELLADSGADAAAYELVDEPGGPLVLLAPRAEAAPLLRATVEGLPGRLARLAGLRLRIEFWQVEFGLDGNGEQSLGRADADAVGAVLDASAAQAVVVLSDSLYYDEVREEGQYGPAFPPDLFRPLADDTGWYHLVEGGGRPGPAADLR